MITIFRYSAEGGFIETHDPAELVELPATGTYLWVDLQAPTPEEAEVLNHPFNFHPLAVEDCWHEPQSSRVDDYGDYLFLVVHGVRRDTRIDEFKTHELNVFLGTSFLVTFHTLHSRSIDAVKESVRRHGAMMARGMDFLLHQIVDRVIDSYFPKLEVMESQIDDLETALVEDVRPELLTRMFELRRTVAHVKRIASQEREVLVQISRGDFAFISERLQVYFKDVYDHLFRIVEAADNHRETLNAMVQVYVSMVSNQLNHTMRVLTLIATIMLPLTVITGIYGMNFDHMPELHWKWGYPLVIGAMLVVSVSMIVWFKRKKWL
ncbi:MAG TPA: magnesium/cobalt transporter CorA [Terriglobia bacterium]|nr:magnesium/cobalt transporter CorA [Terriglobia bacterium]